MHTGLPKTPPSNLTDEEVVRRVVAGEAALFEVLMRRHNQRAYRAIRSVLRDEAEVEDAMQQAYLRAWLNLGRFEGASSFSTWLVRICVNEGLMRLRRVRGLTLAQDSVVLEETAMDDAPSPEKVTETRELSAILERAVDALPPLYRPAFVLREVEGLSTRETAEVLEVSEEVVKTRLHRAKSMVRDLVFSQASGSAGEVFPFHAPRCDRVVASVMERITAVPPEAP